MTVARPLGPCISREGERYMSNTSQVQAQAIALCSPITELRQYTMKPGRRDDLIALFEEHFIEGQEAEGMRIIGQFRNRNNPDQFVWMRGFADMEARRKALEGFYFGPIWKEQRAAANDTIIDSDNVLLLKPARTASSFRFDAVDRPAMDAKGPQGGIVIAIVYAFDAPIDTKFVDFFETKIAPALGDAGATLLGYFVTEPSANTSSSGSPRSLATQRMRRTKPLWHRARRGSNRLSLLCKVGCQNRRRCWN